MEPNNNKNILKIDASVFEAPVGAESSGAVDVQTPDAPVEAPAVCNVGPNGELDMPVIHTPCEVTEPEPDSDTVILPPRPVLAAPFYGRRYGLNAFGFSQQGESHVESDTPCQDRCAMRFTERARAVVTAIADGVGSCVLSDFGAARAVKTAVASACEALDRRASCPGYTFEDDDAMLELLTNAFEAALNAVTALANDMNQLIYSFQSTLTLAVYNGRTLYCGHAGDDGVVAIRSDGSYGLVTQRHKGEEASSVAPLQNTNTWEFTRTGGVTAFAMLTDGALDAVVSGEQRNNRVYFPFFDDVLRGDITDAKALRSHCHDWYYYCAGAKYRERVRDDITVLAVTNPAAMSKAAKPAFDAEKWQHEEENNQKIIDEALYSERGDSPAEAPAADTPAAVPQTVPQTEPQTAPVSPESEGKPEPRQDDNLQGVVEKVKAAIRSAAEAIKR